MNKKGVMLPTILALVLTFIYLMVIQSQKNKLDKSFDKAQVLIAKTDLPNRTVISMDMVETITIPRMYMQQDAYEVRSPSDIKLVNNLVTTTRIPKGNQILSSTLNSLSPSAGLSVKVPPGYRGVVVEVPNTTSALVKPGDRVDVLVTFKARMADNSREPVTATILQNVLVLGVGDDLGQGISSKNVKDRERKEEESAAFSDKGVLSLALAPAEAQYLVLAQQEGQITVIVRNMGEMQLHPIEIASFRRIFGNKAGGGGGN
ncbi:MAG: Flp pilus assembly protein CpaB [Elusimicrobia bacterium]|nr:Flp pilus assembly protein CpaB [Elusimicrobiota bacterium]